MGLTWCDITNGGACPEEGQDGSSNDSGNSGPPGDGACRDGDVWVPASRFPNRDLGLCVPEEEAPNSGGSGALSALQMRQRETLALAGLGLAFFFLLALLS